MNKKLILGFSVLTIAGVIMFSNVVSVDAFGGFGKGHGEGRGFGFVSHEMREEFKEKWQNLTDEEREALKSERHERRDQHRAKFEDFTGMSKEEVKEAYKNGNLGEILEENGVTQEEAEAFLNDKVNEKVERIVEKHDLDEDQEQSIRDRVSEFVQKRLDRWFGN